MSASSRKAAADEAFMQAALDLASQGLGRVEPNPMVGCLIVQDHEIVGRGFHELFGGPHAEVNAIEDARKQGHADLSRATVYVTLEPCSHTGKTGPCVEALIQANVARVVVAVEDPNPQVSGRGLKRLRSAGIQVSTNVLEREARFLLAPYLKKTTSGKPWIIAKWAMTLDGKIATSTGDSKWISSVASREIVHGIRGRVDGVMVGVGTALADNPGLDARPPGVRTATRIVVDSMARIGLESKLVKTARKIPVLIAVGPSAEQAQIDKLESAGCQVFQSFQSEPNLRVEKLLTHLGKLGMTNVLVEGGGKMLGALHDLGQINEVHVFVAAKLLGGRESVSPLGGEGRAKIDLATVVEIIETKSIQDDVYLFGRAKVAPAED